MFRATPSPWFDTDQAVGPALGDLQSDQVEYFSSWSQWVGPQIHPTWVRNGRNKFVLFRFFFPQLVSYYRFTDPFLGEFTGIFPCSTHAQLFNGLKFQTSRSQLLLEVSGIPIDQSFPPGKLED